MYFLKQNIKYLRKNSGLTQPQLGEVIGVSRDNIASYERGTVPPVEIIHKLVRYFHVSFEDFVEKDFSKPETAEVSDLDLEVFQKSGPSRQADAVEHSDERIRSIEALGKIIEAQQNTIKSQQETIEALKMLIERK